MLNRFCYLLFKLIVKSTPGKFLQSAERARREGFWKFVDSLILLEGAWEFFSICWIKFVSVTWSGLFLSLFFSITFLVFCLRFSLGCLFRSSSEGLRRCREFLIRVHLPRCGKMQNTRKKSCWGKKKAGKEEKFAAVERVSCFSNTNSFVIFARWNGCWFWIF